MAALRHDLLDESTDATGSTTSAYYADPYDFVWFAYDADNFDASTQLANLQFAVKKGVTPRKLHLEIVIVTKYLII